MVSLANTKDIREPLKVDALQLEIVNMTLPCSLWLKNECNFWMLCCIDASQIISNLLSIAWMPSESIL